MILFMTHILLALLLLPVLVLGWLVATWYFADDQPALGPQTSGRITFKQVVQNALRDVRDIVTPTFRLLGHLGRIGWHNAALAAVGLLDVYAGLAPELRDIVAHDPRMWAVMALLNLVARFGLPAQPAAHA